MSMFSQPIGKGCSSSGVRGANGVLEVEGQMRDTAMWKRSVSLHSN